VHLNGATVTSDTSRMPDAPGGRSSTDTVPPPRPEVQP
jgi:hypothetical protein